MSCGLSRRVSCPVFVGRTAQTAALRKALVRAAEGRPTTVIVAGEAGVGKSVCV